MPTSHVQTAGTETLIDHVARAAFAIWQWNGHDVVDALRVVAEQHIDPEVKAAATVPSGFATETMHREFERLVDIERRAQSAH